MEQVYLVDRGASKRRLALHIQGVIHKVSRFQWCWNDIDKLPCQLHCAGQQVSDCFSSVWTDYPILSPLTLYRCQGKDGLRSVGVSRYVEVASYAGLTFRVVTLPCTHLPVKEQSKPVRPLSIYINQI